MSNQQGSTSESNPESLSVQANNLNSIIKLITEEINKYEQAVERNWNYQLIINGLSLAIISNLLNFQIPGNNIPIFETNISLTVFGIKISISQQLIYLILPLFHTYLFVRIGYLLTSLTQYLELRKKFLKNLFKIDRSLQSGMESQELENSLSKTFSFFQVFLASKEYKYNQFLLAVYIIFLIFVLSIGHSSTFYFGRQFLNNNNSYKLLIILLFLLVIYSCICWFLYIAFFQAMSQYKQDDLNQERLAIGLKSTMVLMVIFIIIELLIYLGELDKCVNFILGKLMQILVWLKSFGFLYR